MKQILEGKILHMLPVPNGIVAAVLSEVTEDGKIAVEYRHISLETNVVQRVANNVYLLAKFSAGHKWAEMQVKNHLTCRACVLPDQSVFVIEDDASAKLLDAEGFSQWVGIFRFQDETPNDTVFDGKNIWLSFPNNNTLLRIDPDSMREELRIGGKKGGAGFAGPCGMAAYDGDLFVCNKRSKQIWRINTKTYAAAEYQSFEEPVFAYARVAEQEIVHLQSGLYLL